MGKQEIPGYQDQLSKIGHLEAKGFWYRCTETNGTVHMESSTHRASVDPQGNGFKWPK